MAQPSVACYFGSRKRSAVEDTKINRAKKVLVLDSDQITPKYFIDKKLVNSNEEIRTEVCNSKNTDKNLLTKKVISIPSSKQTRVSNNTSKSSKIKNIRRTSTTNNRDIQRMINNMKNKTEESTVLERNEEVIHITPPGTPTKFINALDKVKEKPDGPSIKEIRKKITRSARLAELKASIGRFQENDNKLKDIKKETKKIPESPKLKSFKTIELEVLTR